MASVMRMTSTIGCRGLLTGDDGNAQAKRVCVALANLSGRHTLIERVYWLNERSALWKQRRWWRQDQHDGERTSR